MRKRVMITAPACRICGQPMKLTDGATGKWYCYKDDEIIETHMHTRRAHESARIWLSGLVTLPALLLLYLQRDLTTSVFVFAYVIGSQVAVRFIVKDKGEFVVLKDQ